MLTTQLRELSSQPFQNEELFYEHRKPRPSDELLENFNYNCLFSKDTLPSLDKTFEFFTLIIYVPENKNLEKVFKEDKKIERVEIHYGKMTEDNKEESELEDLLDEKSECKSFSKRQSYLSNFITHFQSQSYESEAKDSQPSFEDIRKYLKKNYTLELSENPTDEELQGALGFVMKDMVKSTTTIVSKTKSISQNLDKTLNEIRAIKEASYV